MAKWSGNKVNPEQINNGNEYTVNDNLSVEAINGIVNNSINAQEKSERALKLAEGANEANGTVVKINGEPQGTWDATFSQELYEESANEFNEITAIGNVDNNTGTFTYTSTGNNLLSVDYMPMKPNTVYSYKTSKSGLWIYEYDSNRKFLGIVDIVSGRSFTSKPNTAYFRVAFWGGYGTTYLNDAIVKEGINPIYHPFNPNRHITNSEAEFLKEEFDKQSNLLPLENKEYTFEATTQYGWKRIQLGQDFVLKAGTYTLDFSMKVASGTGTFNKFSFDYGTTSVFNVGEQVSVGTSYSNINRTFTLSEDITYNAIWIQVAKIGTYTFKEVFVGKEFKEYQPYNSSSHITNTQADLLKSEYEKQKNILDITNFKGQKNNGFVNTINADGSVNSSGTLEKIWANIFAMSNYKLEAGTYTFSINQIFEISVVLKVTRADGSTYDYAINAGKTSTKFTSSQDITKISIFYNHGTIGNTYNINGLKFQLEKGDKATSIQDFNGEIIHEKDIKQIKVWENANPSLEIGYGEKTLNIDNVFDYIYGYLAYYLSNNIVNLTPVFSKIKLKKGGSCFWRITQAVDNNGTIASRVFGVGYDGKLIVENCYVNGTMDNNKIIPLEFYVSNY